MAILPSIIQGWDQNILQGATITSTVAPSSTYILSELGLLLPSYRIIWGTGTVTITFTRGAGAAQGDILVIPASNLITGHATLTNGAGLSQALTFPSLLRNGFPPTMAIDLTVGTPNNATRTSNVWNLVISTNPANVVMGGAVAIYGPKTALTNRGFEWGYSLRKKGPVVESENDYGTEYIQGTGTYKRFLDITAKGTNTDTAMLEGTFDANFGRALPGLIWLDPAGSLGNPATDAMLGVLQGEFKRTHVWRQLHQLSLTIQELSKGEVPL